MNRGRAWLGMWMMESWLNGKPDGADGRIDATRHSERFPRYGNGCPGSTASGVTTGRRVLRK